MNTKTDVITQTAGHIWDYMGPNITRGVTMGDKR